MYVLYAITYDFQNQQIHGISLYLRQEASFHSHRNILFRHLSMHVLQWQAYWDKIRFEQSYLLLLKSSDRSILPI